MTMNETATPTYLDAPEAPLVFTDAAALKVRERYSIPAVCTGRLPTC